MNRSTQNIYTSPSPYRLVARLENKLLGADDSWWAGCYPFHSRVVAIVPRALYLNYLVNKTAVSSFTCDIFRPLDLPGDNSATLFTILLFILERARPVWAPQHSILANNSGTNCRGTITSHGYNLSSDGSCTFSNSGDLNNTNPLLGTFGNHGGPTPTIPLLTGSPAIDAGNPSGCTDGQGHLLTTDQRGMPRPDKPEDTSGCDMGAYETQNLK